MLALEMRLACQREIPSFVSIFTNTRGADQHNLALRIERLPGWQDLGSRFGDEQYFFHYKGCTVKIIATKPNANEFVEFVGFTKIYSVAPSEDLCVKVEQDLKSILEPKYIINHKKLQQLYDSANVCDDSIITVSQIINHLNSILDPKYPKEKWVEYHYVGLPKVLDFLRQCVSSSYSWEFLNPNLCHGEFPNSLTYGNLEGNSVFLHQIPKKCHSYLQVVGENKPLAHAVFSRIYDIAVNLEFTPLRLYPT